MTREPREIAIEMVSEFMGRYSVPQGVSIEGQDAVICSIATEMARRLGEDDFEAAVNAILVRVGNSHKTTRWPAQGVFIDLLPRPKAGFAKLESFHVNPFENAVKCMERHDGVNERYLWGVFAGRLRAAGATDAMIDRYRMGCVANWRRVHREGASGILDKLYGSEVLPYLAKVPAR